MTIVTTRKPIAAETLEQLSTCSLAASQAFATATTQNVNVGAALAVADSIHDLRQLFDRPEVKARIESLQDTPLGFRTDRDPKITNKRTGQPSIPYDWPIVRDASIESALRGLQLVGNQWNIISSRFYCTKEGFEALIRKLPGLTEFRPVVDVPATRNGGAIVLCKATWKMGGAPANLEVSIPVKTDDYSGADQIIGKATRKFLKRCYEMMCGMSVPEGEAGDTDGARQIEDAGSRFASAPKEIPATVKEAAPAQEPVKDLSPFMRLTAFVVTECNSTFDQFCTVLGEMKPDWLDVNPDNWAAFEEVPDAVCETVLANKRGMKSMLAAQAIGGAK